MNKTQQNISETQINEKENTSINPTSVIRRTTQKDDEERNYTFILQYEESFFLNSNNRKTKCGKIEFFDDKLNKPYNDCYESKFIRKSETPLERANTLEK